MKIIKKRKDLAMPRTPRNLVICEITKTVEGAMCFVVVDSNIYNSIRTCKRLLRNSDMPQNRYYAIIEIAETLKIITEVRKRIRSDKTIFSKTEGIKQNEPNNSVSETTTTPTDTATNKENKKSSNTKKSK